MSQGPSIDILALLQKASPVRAILWDPDHDIMRGYETSEEAAVEKGEDEDIEFFDENDPDFLRYCLTSSITVKTTKASTLGSTRR